MIRGHTALLPSGPNTKLEPTKAKSSSRLITAAERLEDAAGPTAVLSTISANSTCRPSPQATVRRSIARRLVESA